MININLKPRSPSLLDRVAPAPKPRASHVQAPVKFRGMITVNLLWRRRQPWPTLSANPFRLFASGLSPWAIILIIALIILRIVLVTFVG